MPEFRGDPVFSAEELLAQASERLRGIQAAWEEAGRPLTTEGSMGQVIEHPLVKLLRETEVVVLRLGEAARKRHRGPEPKAVVRAKIGKAPSQRLKRVK